MARGTRKSASDSTAQLLRDARAPDTSAATAPRDLPGCEFMDDFGFDVLDTYYRERTEWTAADLTLIVMAANAAQQLRDARREIETRGLIIVTPHTTKPNPMLAVSEALSNRIQKCLQAAGLRQRDGQPASRPSVTASAPTEGGAVVGFDQWMKDQMK